MPSSVMGTTGTCSLAATVKAPFLNSIILPDADRVPCEGASAGARSSSACKRLMTHFAARTHTHAPLGKTARARCGAAARGTCSGTPAQATHSAKQSPLAHTFTPLLRAHHLAASVHALQRHVAGQVHGPADDGNEEVAGLGNELHTPTRSAAPTPQQRLNNATTTPRTRLERAAQVEERINVQVALVVRNVHRRLVVFRQVLRATHLRAAQRASQAAPRPRYATQRTSTR